MGWAHICNAWRGLHDSGSIFSSAADFLDGTKYTIYLHFQKGNNLLLSICSSTVSCWRQLYVAHYNRVSSPIRIKTSALISVVKAGLV